jgi:hypothetical protein
MGNLHFQIGTRRILDSNFLQNKTIKKNETTLRKPEKEFLEK